MAENSLIRLLEEDHSNLHLVLVKLFKDGTRLVNLRVASTVQAKLETIKYRRIVF